MHVIHSVFEVYALTLRSPYGRESHKFDFAKAYKALENDRKFLRNFTTQCV